MKREKFFNSEEFKYLAETLPFVMEEKNFQSKFDSKEEYIEFLNNRIKAAISDINTLACIAQFFGRNVSNDSIVKKEGYISHIMQFLYFLEHKSLEELFELDMNDLDLIKQVNLSINEQIQLEDSVKEVVKKEIRSL